MPDKKSTAEIIDLTKSKIDTDALFSIPENVAKTQKTVAYNRTADSVWVAMVDPDDFEFVTLLEKKFKKPVKVTGTTTESIAFALKAYQKDVLEQLRALLARMTKHVEEQDVVKLVDLILVAAQRKRASDIHIEPEEKNVVVRFRIDGELHEMFRYSKDVHDKVVFRVKILSRLRTDEHMQAQDGRFEVRFPEGRLNLRVSILPITYGENVVMRLLSEAFQKLRLEDLGFLEDDLEKVVKASKLPYGMILTVGPTGSGKTTTLYAVLNILNTPDVNIITIEDPVEYNIPGIRQIQVNPVSNLTFEEGLRSILRQDPDIIMVGEIRDPQTANIAVNAALTGHLLLSTLHTNDAASTFARLLEMDLEPFLVASSVSIVIAQRLVRKICGLCTESTTLDEHQIQAIMADAEFLKLVRSIGGEEDLKKLKVFRGKGCPNCGHIGYKGRTGIYELLEVTDEIRPLIVSKVSADDIRETAFSQGMRTMLEDGLIKVFKGLTTIDEIIRVTKA